MVIRRGVVRRRPVGHAAARTRYVKSVEYVTIFRSADESAEDDATRVAQNLNDAGIPAKVQDDSAPGVPEGAWEVCVAREDSVRADAYIATHPLEDEMADPDESHDLDMVTVFRSVGTGTESEAMAVKGLLDSAGIPAVIVADARWPNLPEHVRAPRAQAAEARRVIAEALVNGPGAADEAEAEGEALS